MYVCVCVCVYTHTLRQETVNTSADVLYSHMLFEIHEKNKIMSAHCKNVSLRGNNNFSGKIKIVIPHL